MKNKKVLLTITALLIISVACIFSAFAHSGRTDSNGGHWDRSTGTYHYHSGEHAGKSSSSSNSKEYEHKGYTPPSKQETATNEKNKTDFYDVLVFIILYVFPWLFILALPLIYDFFKKRR